MAVQESAPRPLSKIERMTELANKLIETRPWLIDSFIEIMDMAVRKGNDYGRLKDTLANLRICGWKGVVVRLSDKMSRLLSFVERANNGDPTFAVKDESMHDTLLDLAHYAVICSHMYDIKCEGIFEQNIKKTAD